jgi:hypothetical protein
LPQRPAARPDVEANGVERHLAAIGVEHHEPRARIRVPRLTDAARVEEIRVLVAQAHRATVA